MADKTVTYTYEGDKDSKDNYTVRLDIPGVTDSDARLEVQVRTNHGFKTVYDSYASEVTRKLEDRVMHEYKYDHEDGRGVHTIGVDLAKEGSETTVTVIQVKTPEGLKTVYRSDKDVITVSDDGMFVTIPSKYADIIRAATMKGPGGVTFSGEPLGLDGKLTGGDVSVPKIKDLVKRLKSEAEKSKREK